MGYRILLLLAVLASLFCSAAPPAPLTVAVGLRLAPYVLDDSSGGLEYEYVDAIMRKLGYRMRPKFMFLGDVATAIRTGQADMALTLQADMVPGLAVSRPYVAYQNVAISLQARHLEIRGIADLKPFSVAAFAEARQYLGPAFAAQMAGKTDYHEHPNQIRQNISLYQGQSDVVVVDVNIFAFLDQRLGSEVKRQPVTVHEIFPRNEYVAAFRDPVLRDRFNEVLSQARSLPEFEAIKLRWQGRLRQPIENVLLDGSVQ
ncbi:amino acid ABC transporter substrate-binding protein [Chitinimonas arctica]|uniref:Amino acid ABC transporter substrate-binding protein n=1 Tax=Chitinimonas arctica TaxID=2594795 RepID=A0A516SFW8_9NEIS|nr:transporter substrate-binding domain-containing protein [Chitinimonas arctica]QDQ26918.1 amino acid ABC transporter substrate-binding protein [Chitinimonas arctica]